jgi:hypothetical protein
MTPGEVRQLQKDNNSDGNPATAGQVLCAYRIPITLNKESEDGTPFALGSFYRNIVIGLDGEEGKTEQVVVRGWVRGAVSVLDDKEGSGVRLGLFPTATGTRTTLRLLTEEQNMKLAFDRERTPAFLSGSFEGEPQEVGKSRRQWTLQIEVLPGQVDGPFPRPEGQFQDSAIYLKATQPGKKDRHIRIPVDGTATAGGAS